MRTRWPIFGVIYFCLSVSSASAVTLSLEPTLQNAGPGDTVGVNLNISGLGNFSPDSLGVFDVDIQYDPSSLSLSGFSLGPFLGDISLGEAIDISLGDLGGGVVNVAEISLLEPDFLTCIFCIPPFLDDIQPDAFSLATLEFLVDVLPEGTSTNILIDEILALGDGFGVPLSLDVVGTATIRNPRGQSVPEPTTLLLLGLGLAGLGFARRH